jgi:predicted O-methyltransferase YrrM
VSVVQRLKSLAAKSSLGRRARDVYRDHRRQKIETRRWEARHLRDAFPLPGGVEQDIVRTIRTIHEHWCPSEKPRVLASLIIRDRIERSVEIGVYTGASFAPQAIAARHVGGLAVAIDPYAAAEAEQVDNAHILEPLREELRKRDWDAIYAGFLQMLERHDLTASSKILRMTSADAADLIEPGIGLLHIDGNHDYLKLQRDIEQYVPKLKPGGYLVLDDIGWSTIEEQYEALKQRMTVVYEEPGRWGCLASRGSRP